MEKRIVAVVRAIPHMPHKRRWCGLERWVPDPANRSQQEMEELPTGGFKPKFDEQGKPIYAKHALPWPDTEVKVYVVDKPAPYDPNANGGAPVEISPASLRMLEQDERIAVRLLGEGVDASDVAHAKARIAEVENEVTALARAKSELAERLATETRSRAAAENLAQAATEKTKALELELAELRTKLEKRK